MPFIQNWKKVPWFWNKMPSSMGPISHLTKSLPKEPFFRVLQIKFLSKCPYFKKPPMPWRNPGYAPIFLNISSLMWWSCVPMVRCFWLYETSAFLRRSLCLIKPLLLSEGLNSFNSPSLISSPFISRLYSSLKKPYWSKLKLVFPDFCISEVL